MSIQGWRVGRDGIAYQEKVAADAREYSLDWSDEIDADAAIATSSWSAESGIAVGVTGGTGKITTVWLSGGTAGTSYLVTNTITTSKSPEQVVRSFRLKIVAALS